MIQRRGPAQDLRATIDRLPLDVRQGILDGIQGQRIIAGAHADGGGGLCPMVAAEVPWTSVSKSSVECAQEAARAWDRYAEAGGSSRTATKRQLLALTSMLEASILHERAETEIALSDAIADYERAKSGRSVEAVSIAHEAVPLARDAFPGAPVTHPGYLGLADAYEVTPIELPAERPAVREVVADRPTPIELPPERQTPVELPGERPAVHEVAAARPTPREEPVARPRSRKRQDTGERDRSAELGERDGWAWLRPFRSYDEYEETLLRALAELDTHERELEELHTR